MNMQIVKIEGTKITVITTVTKIQGFPVPTIREQVKVNGVLYTVVKVLHNYDEKVIYVVVRE